MLLRTLLEVLEKQSKRRRNKKPRKQKRRRRQQEQQTQPKEALTYMPLAYALARSWAWPALQYRCQTHPQEVSEISRDVRGETILHWACIGKPPHDTVQAILAVCPEMTRVRNQEGHLPLHVAISYRSSVEVVRALLEAFPESAGLPNGMGVYPLHLLCDYGSCVDSLSAVLETPAGAATIDKTMPNSNHTALDILSSRMHYAVFRRAIQSMKEARRRQQATKEALIQRKEQERLQKIKSTDLTSIDESCNQETIPALTASNERSAAAAFDRNERMISSFQQNDYWQKAALLVLVSYTQQPLSPKGLEDEAANLVHACAGVSNCPGYLLEFAILLHIDDLARKKDRQGRLPLHVAAQHHARILQTMAQDGNNYDRTLADKALTTILEACPASARAQDAEGNLPLAVAIKEIRKHRKPGTRAWSSGLQQLLEANIAALETLSLEASIYPFVWSNRLNTVDSLFQSIRHQPGLFDQQKS